MTCSTDIEDVYQELIEDNIVAVSRQMIDKEASTAKPGEQQLNGHSNGTNGAANGEGKMDVDDEL